MKNKHSYKFKHGHARSGDKPASAEYAAYMGAKSRCRRSNDPSYHRYGGRGIKFKFTSFKDFFAVMGKRPSAAYSLDRFPNNDGHYEKGNVRWATRSQQQNNKSNNHHITYKGRRLSAAEWALFHGWARNTVRERLRSGWCEHCAVTLPARTICPHRKVQRHTRWVLYKGETRSIADWTKRMNLTRGVIAHRLSIGWSVEETLLTPVGNQGRKPNA